MKRSAKFYPVLALASLAAVIVCAYLWCTLAGTVANAFCVVTLAFAALFVYAVNQLSNRIAPVEHLPEHSGKKGSHAA